MAYSRWVYLVSVSAKDLLLRRNDIYKFITLLPKDYCLIPGNGAIKLVDRTNTHVRIYDTITRGLLSNPRQRRQ